MTAGVSPVAQPSRCGCCDRPNAGVRCERCDEPTCIDHLRRVERPGDTPAYRCLLCVEAEQIPVERVRAPWFEVVA